MSGGGVDEAAGGTVEAGGGTVEAGGGVLLAGGVPVADGLVLTVVAAPAVEVATTGALLATGVVPESASGTKPASNSGGLLLATSDDDDSAVPLAVLELDGLPDASGAVVPEATFESEAVELPPTFEVLELSGLLELLTCGVDEWALGVNSSS
jgi:hypothetical protein